MERFEQLAVALRQSCPALELREHEPMARHTTFRIGGPVRLMALPRSEGEVLACLREAERAQVRLVVLGNGSNLLAADEGVDLLVIATGRMDRLERLAGNTIRAWAGVSLARLAVFAMEQGLQGLAFAHGIPGSLGGAVFMNAGAYDGQMAGIVEQTEYLDETGALHTLTGEEHGFGYRRSVFRDRPDWTVVRSTLRLQQGDPAAILDRMNDLAQRRREKQPLNFPSAGSTFKRPEGYFAGRLIEDAGLKGVSVGAAQVSEKHAGFLINRGGATCDDMLHLIELVQQRVKEAFGVQLECEVRIIR